MNDILDGYLWGASIDRACSGCAYECMQADAEDSRISSPAACAAKRTECESPGEDFRLAARIRVGAANAEAEYKGTLVVHQGRSSKEDLASGPLLDSGSHSQFVHKVICMT